MRFDPKTLAVRKPLWIAMSDLFLDTELQDYHFSYIARKMHESGYSLDELEQILMLEVFPVCIANLHSVAGFDMANTSLSLGDHWEHFIKDQISTGRYGSASELVRDSLRLLEQRELKIEALRSALIEGEQSGSEGELDMSAIKRKARLKAGLDD
ncbi:Antitoxin ParD [Nymphon striatum]|nr:Antitoxin ParD [Nymphon striatum]